MKKERKERGRFKMRVHMKQPKKKNRKNIKNQKK